MLEWSATELSRAIHARKIAPSEVMAAWLARVAAVNGEINAVISLRETTGISLHEVDRVDRERLIAETGASPWLSALTAWSKIARSMPLRKVAYNRKPASE